MHLHTDDFYGFIAAGYIPPYLAEADTQNHTVMEVALGAAFAYADGGFDVVVDGIVGPWMLDHCRRRAAAHPDIAVHYVVLRPSRETTLGRAQARSAPDALVEREPILGMWDAFAQLDDLETHVLDTSELSVDDTVEAVEAILGSGRLALV